jgi:uncharacterized membrane protein
MTPDDPIEVYIARLRKALSGFSVGEREDIVEEIRTHIVDRVAESGLTVEETLARLGPAEELAKDYRSGALVRRARSSFSPWTILRATFRWAMTGVHGLSVFFLAVLGYGGGTALILAALLKPLFPEQTGVWIGPDDFVIGFRPSPEAHEMLGPWFTQIALALGTLFFIVTTLVVRRLLPRFRRWRISAAAATSSVFHRA